MKTKKAEECLTRSAFSYQWIAYNALPDSKLSFLILLNQPFTKAIKNTYY